MDNGHYYLKLLIVNVCFHYMAASKSFNLSESNIFSFADPNIPETGEQRLKSSRGDEDCCYSHCGSPGRGGAPISIGGQPGGTSYILGICEHCPGRPMAVSRAAGRTFNKVLFILWTTSVLFSFLQTENVSRAFLSCLLYSVRTVYRRVFTDRTHS